ncbi:GHKL domain-containing protein [Salmonella enterica subsp. enterica serovar Rubislaw]|uniref:histidine kinase n=1 Tax=Salmonella rubislaw TaxID=598 RepID=A0A5W9CKR9_SALRU|nr:GHKL domain-containing protein [Salmonella enterica]EAM9827969.1 GHKL domain-containing protein [Salmonella enterica]EBV5650560.1 ATP-binding protein [Salmonella enterica subsp. enterica serovar Rubislaw]EBY3180464.1 GHKL domain-containing protein [Salmonella enterica subsp. enterica serovar Rubislaw]
MRYTPPGKTITLRIKEADDQIHIIVENPGTPIAPEHLPLLFDRFYRVTPSRQRKGEGRGIGLAIVKSIVIAHQGKVSVTSDTRYSFYFDIPQTPPLNCSDSERRYH